MTIPQAIRKAPVGKVVGGALYVHVTALDTLPPMLLDLVGDALAIAEPDTDTLTLVKITPAGVVSFLDYESFDEDPHPALLRAVTVSPAGVRRATYRRNRPILHRKETFVAPDYPGYETFAAFTEAEEAAGLLGRQDIGREDQWADVLSREGWRLDGHHLRRR